MSPLECRRLVGHPDIVERARTVWREITESDGGECDLMAIVREQADEIDRLRAALRAVRACTDPVWAAQIINDALRETQP